jgi:O-antigen ligase
MTKSTHSILNSMPWHHALPMVCLLLFSLSLSLSKSAVNVLMTLTYLTSLVLIVRYQEYRRSVVMNINQPMVLPLLVYLAVAVIGIIHTEVIADGFGIANKVASLFLVYFMTSIVIDTIHDRDDRAKLTDKLILIFIAGVLALDVIGLLTYFGVFGQRKFTLPVYPMHVHHIWFANINAVGIYAALSFILFRSSPRELKRRTLLIVFIILALISILLSISRTSWFGMIATGIVLAYLYTDKKRIFSITIAVGVSSCLLAYYFIPFIYDRINIIYTDIIVYSTTGGDTYSSLGDRFLMWKSAIKMFLTNPIFGVGTGDYVTSIKSYVSAGLLPTRMLEYNQPHNMYLFSLATNGILGLGALLFIFYRIFVFTRPFTDIPPGQQQLFFLATAVAIHYLVAGMTDSLFNIFILRFSFAFIMGICIRIGTSPTPET